MEKSGFDFKINELSTNSKLIQFLTENIKITSDKDKISELYDKIVQHEAHDALLDLIINYPKYY